MDYHLEKQSFDLIFAFTMIHHLEIESFSWALKSLIRPKGKMFFSWEPYFWNKSLSRLRYSKIGLMAFPERRDTILERSLSLTDVAAFKKHFQVSQLPINTVPITILRRIFGNRKRPWLWPFFRLLIWPMPETKWSFDQFGDVESRLLKREHKLLRKFPILKFLCRNTHIILKPLNNQ